MISQFGESTLVAILIGVFLAVLAFIPTVAIRYRKAGTLRFVDLMLLLMVAIYGMTLWTYTLIPLPETTGYACVRSNFVPFEFILDIIKEQKGSSLSGLIHNKALFQVLFNVIFFTPLGFFIRLLSKRGLVTATVIGFAISALIETTQLTGIWHLYPCAYRTFDVDDLIMNTLGALVGSLIAIPIMIILDRGRKPIAATNVTAGRRTVGIIADLLMFWFISVGVLVGYRAIARYLFGISFAEMDNAGIGILVFWAPLIFEAYCVLIIGRTFGEIAVGIRPDVTGNKAIWQRPLKFVLGVGGYSMFTKIEGEYANWIWIVFIFASVICIFVTKHHRGLTGLLTNSDMVIVRSESQRSPENPESSATVTE